MRLLCKSREELIRERVARLRSHILIDKYEHYNCTQPNCRCKGFDNYTSLFYYRIKNGIITGEVTQHEMLCILRCENRMYKMLKR